MTAKRNTKAKAYDANREAAARRSRERSAAAREIGEIPPVSDHARKAKALASLRFFLETYFAAVYFRPWSADHLKAIVKIENAVNHGGLFAFAMPRAAGKTTLCEGAALWAVLTGRRRFAFLIGATAEEADDRLANLKQALAENDDLAADWPEVCYPIRRLEEQTKRAKGQTHHGHHTAITWGKGQIILPTVPGSRASGAIIRTRGILGRIRGANYRTRDGRMVRPDIVFADDPQTDESADNPASCSKRLSILNGAVRNLAGPGRKIAIFCPCTVIRKNDLADRLLDTTANPAWQGERAKMIYAWPDAAAGPYWEQYAKIRAESLRQGRGLEPATAFYAENRAAMDAGAVVGWAERYDDDELSALQHAYNHRLHDARTFWADMQNEPLADTPTAAADERPNARAIAAKTHHLGRGIVPATATRLAAFVDVQDRLLFWVVVAWGDAMGGAVVDYGTWPPQRRGYFAANDDNLETITARYPAAGFEAGIYTALEDAAGAINHTYRREDGADQRLDALGVDANWGASTETVYQWTRQTKSAAGLAIPCHGRGIGAASRPIEEWNRKPGDRGGPPGWHFGTATNRPGRRLIYDSNQFKTLIHTRLRAAAGDPGALYLFEPGETPHELIADHLAAEFPTTTQGRGRQLQEWRLIPGQTENHFLDCLVGSAAVACVKGATPSTIAAAKPRQTIKFSQAKRRRLN